MRTCWTSSIAPGVRAVGYDVLFRKPRRRIRVGDATLDAMAQGGNGRFVFGSSRVHPDLDDEPGATPVAQAPGAFKLAPDAHASPRVALLLPYGKAMSAHSALLDITRASDGVIRDIPLREEFGIGRCHRCRCSWRRTRPDARAASFPAAVRVNWRVHSQLPSISAADLLEGKASVAIPTTRCRRSRAASYSSATTHRASTTPSRRRRTR